MYKEPDGKYKLTNRFSEKTFKNMEAAMKLVGVRSKNEFIESALNYYSGILMMNENQNVLADSIERLVKGIVRDSENRIARLQFKEAVELAKVANVLAYTSELDAETIEKLHLKCVNEVKKINGTINFEDAYRYQKS